MKFPPLLYLAVTLAATPLTYGEQWNPKEAARHLIVVDRRGEPMYPIITRDGVGKDSKYHVTLAKFDSKEVPFHYRDHVEKIVTAIEKTQDHRVLFFIHGGMNFVQGAAERAARIYGSYCDHLDGYPGLTGYANIDAQGYPVFICWDSPFTGYTEQVAYVRAGKTERYGRSVGHKMFAAVTLPFHLLADVGRGVVRFPEDFSQFAHNDLYIIAPKLFSEYGKMQEEVSCLRGESPDCTTLPPEDHIDVSQVESVSTPGHFLADLQTTLLFPIRNLSLPLIDSVGVGAWDNMLRHTETMFDRTDTESWRSHTPVEKEVEHDQTGAIAMFFARLNKANSERRTRSLSPFQITLVGHSMGTIICNRVINSYPDLTYSNIVYMGAACSVREFEASVLTYLARLGNQHTQFYNLSLHPRCEAGEIAFSPGKFSVDAAPRGSLPVWIDNLFAHPPSEGQRRYGIFQTAVLASHNIPRTVRKQVHLKCFPFGGIKSADGLNHCPQHHADFAEAPFWNCSFWQVEGRRYENAKTSASQAPSRLYTVSAN